MQTNQEEFKAFVESINQRNKDIENSKEYDAFMQQLEIPQIN